MEQNFLNCGTPFNFESDSVKQQRHPVSACQGISETDNGCFDCNICLDSAMDPVVTFCGHLYCWPCIYKWIHARKDSHTEEEEDREQPSCPVCKANISVQLLIPLYGRGRSSPTSEVNKTSMDLRVPLRPTPTGLNTSPASAELLPNYFHPPSEAVHRSQHYPFSYDNYTASLSSNPGSITTNNVVHPAIGLFGDMVYTRIFGGSDTRLFAFPHSSALTGRNSSRRMRRQERHLERSLNRVSIFLFCCIIICLILF